jgi:hypothetical protein
MGDEYIRRISKIRRMYSSPILTENLTTLPVGGSHFYFLTERGLQQPTVHVPFRLVDRR